MKAADDVRDDGTKNVGQQGDHEESEEDQANCIAASRHELPFSLAIPRSATQLRRSHEERPALCLNRWCHTRAAPMRLASSPSEARASSVFSNGTNLHPWLIVLRMPSRKRAALFITLPPKTITSGTKRLIRLARPRPSK